MESETENEIQEEPVQYGNQSQTQTAKSTTSQNGQATLTDGGPTNMASVGGWTVTTGSVMDHYNKHALATLSSDQQALVEKIAKGI